MTVYPYYSYIHPVIKEGHFRVIRLVWDISWSYQKLVYIEPAAFYNVQTETRLII
jgi:hypothetical protein